MDSGFWTGFVAGAATFMVTFLLAGIGFLIVRPWIRMKLSGGRGSLLQIIGMRLRGNPPTLIVEAHISLLHSGDDARLMEVESQYVANRTKIVNSRDLMELVREAKRSESANKDGRKQ